MQKLEPVFCGDKKNIIDLSSIEYVHRMVKGTRQTVKECMSRGIREAEIEPCYSNTRMNRLMMDEQ